MSYSSSQTAKLLGVSRNTLLRWFREGRVSDGPRDRNGWRVFGEQEIEALRAFVKTPAVVFPATEGTSRMCAYFAQVPLFKGLPATTLQALAGAAQFKGLLKGQWLFAPGEVSKGLYILVKGRVRVYRLSPEGREQTLTIAETSQIVGESQVFAEASRHANHAVALASSTVVLLPKLVLRRLTMEHPSLSQVLLREFSRRVMELEDRLEAQTWQSVEQRLARCLLDDQQRSWSLGDLAAYLGVARETLSRIAKRWSNDGLIERNRGRVKILDAERLSVI